MDQKLINNLKDLDGLNRQRTFWLRMSSLVVFVVVLVIFNWDYVVSRDLLWVFVSSGLIITIIWWYWTLSIVRKLIAFKAEETALLYEIIKDLKKFNNNLNQDS